MKANYYLKGDKKKENHSIRLHCTYKNQVLRYPVGISIKPKQWNKDTQLIASGVKDSEILNEYLYKLRDAAIKEYYRCKNESKPFSLDYLKQFLTEKYRNDIKKPVFIDEFIKEYISDRDRRVSDRTNSKYNTFYNHFISFQEHYNEKYKFTDLNNEFYNKFIDYFVIQLKHENRTIKDKHLSVLASFLNWCVEKSYINKNPFKNARFPYKINPADTVSLSENELNTLFNLELKNERLDRTRDIFCLECFCGLRYSDMDKILPENLKGNHLELYTQKGSNKLIIPLRPEALKIINKYFDKANPFPYLSNQKLNVYLKELCEIAGFNELIPTLSISGKNKQTETFKKFELISTHAARRTFVTLSVQRGMNYLDIMSITGHEKLETFMKYYKPGQSKVSENFFNAYATIKPAYSINEIIKNLVNKEIDKKLIAEAFGIEIESIK
ncbi:MAG: site-specific integrase [Bacteroidales bacterium]